MVQIRFAYDDHDSVSLSTGHSNSEPSRTQQQYAEEADINGIVRRFNLTGQLPVAGSIPLVTNGDFVDNLTYQEAMDIVVAGERAFSAMPAEVRARFNHDPAKFVDFCSDVETNRAELERLGLAVPKAKVVDPVVPEASKT